MTMVAGAEGTAAIATSYEGGASMGATPDAVRSLVGVGVGSGALGELKSTCGYNMARFCSMAKYDV